MRRIRLHNGHVANALATNRVQALPDEGVCVEQVPTEAAAAVRRSLWLAELSKALEDARQLLEQLGETANLRDSSGLYARIEAARAEVEALRLRRAARDGDQSHPNRINLPPWPDKEIGAGYRP